MARALSLKPGPNPEQATCGTQLKKFQSHTLHMADPRSIPRTWGSQNILMNNIKLFLLPK